jgi:NAD(P)-dependent dehydrogenase (short-subunit alcohol dehydrogenase family)
MAALLEGKVIAVIGGNGLIGRKTVAAIVEHGGRVIAASRSGEFPSAILDRLCSEERERVGVAKVDINSPSSADKFYEDILRLHGQCNGVVNLAFPKNFEFGSKFEEVTYPSFLENVGTHLGGAFLVCQKAAALFSIQKKGGVIINCSSVYGFMSPRFDIYEGTSMTKEVEYVVAKAAIIQLTRYLAQYLKGRGIRVNCISPGGVLDNQPQSFVDQYNAHCNTKGMLNGRDVAGTIVFLLSDLATHVTGQNIVVDDGFSL